jgi:hypothetical protein
MPKARIGEHNPKAKLTSDEVRAIRRSAEPQRWLASFYGVSRDTIYNIRARITWRHIDSPDDLPQPETHIGEQWKPVADKRYDRYEVSDMGRIRNRRGGPSFPSPIRRTVVNAFGYTACFMTQDGRRKLIPVHKMVADAFLGERPPRHQVNHINADKSDNRASNLEYVTAQRNKRHAMEHGLFQHGESHHKAKLTLAQVDEIRAAPKRAIPSHVLATKFGVSKGTIDIIRQGKSWTHDVPGSASIRS